MGYGVIPAPAAIPKAAIDEALIRPHQIERSVLYITRERVVTRTRNYFDSEVTPGSSFIKVNLIKYR
mgnify:CR=1 FL=1